MIPRRPSPRAIIELSTATSSAATPQVGHHTDDQEQDQDQWSADESTLGDLDSLHRHGRKRKVRMVLLLYAPTSVLLIRLYVPNIHFLALLVADNHS
jgi:hypothetical protein